MNDDGQYLSHSDAEPMSKKKPIKKFGNPARNPSPVRQLKDQRGFVNPGAASTATPSDGTQTQAVAPTDDFAHEVKASISNIMVAVRMRPMWTKETDGGEFPIVRLLDRKVVILRDPADVMNEEKVLGKNRSKEKQYAFDYAFDTDTS